MAVLKARFGIGEPVRHKLFGYRGVVFDADPDFRGTEEWYAQMALSQPPRDQPWYHVLVHDASHTTYVAERNLEPDESGDPIRHPLLDHFFDGHDDGRYHRKRTGMN